MPKNTICLALVRGLGNAIITTTSATTPPPRAESFHDASLIHDHFGWQVEAVIEGSRVSAEPSSIISLVNDTPQIIRRGAGDVVTAPGTDPFMGWTLADSREGRSCFAG